MSSRVRSAEARSRIVGAAERLLRERPYRELNVDQLMAEAGLSRTVFYRHFDGLPAVVLSLLADIEAHLATVVTTATPDQTRDVLEAAVEVYRLHGPFLRAVDAAARHDAAIEAAYEALVDRFTAMIAVQLATAMEEGRVAPGNPHELARAMNLMNLHYLVDTLGRDPGFDPDLALDTLLAVWEPLTSHAS